MKRKTCLLLISFLVSMFLSAQIKTDSLLHRTEKSEHNIFIAVDLLNPITGFFSTKKNYNAFMSYQIKNRWVAVVDVGYEQNKYKKNDWNVEGKGMYGAVGINYIISNNYEKAGEGFYVGARIGFSPFKQEIKKYPIKAVNSLGQIQTTGEGSFPKTSVSSIWAEGIIGAKVQVENSPFYIDFILKPKFLMYSKKQEGIDNLVIPGYGRNKAAVNISFFWGVGYKIF